MVHMENAEKQAKAAKPGALPSRSALASPITIMAAWCSTTFRRPANDNLPELGFLAMMQNGLIGARFPPRFVGKEAGSHGWRSGSP